MDTSCLAGQSHGRLENQKPKKMEKTKEDQRGRRLSQDPLAGMGQISEGHQGGNEAPEGETLAGAIPSRTSCRVAKFWRLIIWRPLDVSVIGPERRLRMDLIFAYCFIYCFMLHLFHLFYFLAD